jgi:hypothetical protein
MAIDPSRELEPILVLQGFFALTPPERSGPGTASVSLFRQNATTLRGHAK